MPHFRTLTPRDIPGALHLSTQAGWNQLDADWHRLIKLWPESTIGGFEGETLVVTGTLAVHGKSVGADIAWIGMILVEQNQRGKGLGTTMMNTLLDVARKRGVKTVGLDATDMGKPVYEKLGFTTHSIVNRWLGGTAPQRPPNTGAAIPPESRKLTADLWQGVEELDLAAVGAPRGKLLRHLYDEAGSEARAVVQNGKVTAFGFARPGRTARYIGPIIAQTAGGASAIFGDLFPPDANTPTLIDVPDGSMLRYHLRSAGFSVQRKLTRMLLSLDTPPGTTALPLTSQLVHAGAGFELG